MSKYLDLVLCDFNQDGKPYLFIAPAWSNLKKGDAVVVDSDGDDSCATVLSVITVSEDDEQKIEFAIRATRATAPLKRVISKIVFREFEYEEDEDNEQSDND